MADFVVHRDVYEAVITIWNQRVELAGREFDIGEFFDYLLNVYAGLAPLLESLQAGSGREVSLQWVDIRDRSQDNPVLKPPSRKGALTTMVNEVNTRLDAFRPQIDATPLPGVAAG
jgi:hypothetical protein